MSWLEVRLDLPGELVEPVAELLARYTEGGVALEETTPEEGAPASDLHVIIRAYIPQDGQLEERRKAIEQGLWHLSQIAPLPAPTFQNIAEQDWNELWRERYKPMPIGRFLMVLPAWVEPPDTERHMIIIEPGMAFGTGTHPTTRMSLLAIEEYCDPGDRIIDLGCGSGILSIAAIRCGAHHALALDIDAEAFASAQHNLRLNQMVDQVQLVHGSLVEAKQIAPAGGVPLVVANILAPILIELLEQGLSSLVAPGGILILSGILEGQLDSILDCAEKHGLERLKIYAEADWRAAVFAKGKEAPQA